MKRFYSYSLMPPTPPVLLSHLQSLSLTTAECVVRDAALEREGGFRHELLYSMPDDTSAVLSDGQNAYVIGQPKNSTHVQKALRDMPHGSVLGRSALLLAHCAESDYQLLPKDFAFCRSETSLMTPELPENISVKPLTFEENLRIFCELHSAFYAEETGAEIRSDDLYEKFQKRYEGLQAVVMARAQKTIGMVSSHLHSSESAMINMLYIAKNERGKGYGSLLMRWYMAHLLQSSHSLCLFYSPDNDPAAALYKNLGFQKEEEWILAVKF